jgi:hypothetical protein
MHIIRFPVLTEANDFLEGDDPDVLFESKKPDPKHCYLLTDNSLPANAHYQVSTLTKSDDFLKKDDPDALLE